MAVIEGEDLPLSLSRLVIHYFRTKHTPKGSDFEHACRAAFGRSMDSVLAAVRGRDLPPDLSRLVIHYFRTKYTLQGAAQGGGQGASLAQLPPIEVCDLASVSVPNSTWDLRRTQRLHGSGQLHEHSRKKLLCCTCVAPGL